MGLFSFFFGGGKRNEALKAAYAAGAQIIDVRTPAEFKQGHAKGAVNIPLNTLESNLKKINSGDLPVILCCRSGQRAGMAQSMLKAKGIKALNAGAWQMVERLR
jgi:rhodanese-related sulfurtransferase